MVKRASVKKIIVVDGKMFDNVFSISTQEIKESTWLVVAFLIGHGKIRKFKYYIGKVLRINTKDQEFEASFLRYRSTKQFQGHIYCFPDVPDVCTFESDQIVGRVFPVVDSEHPSSSKREFLQFAVNQRDLE